MNNILFPSINRSLVGSLASIEETKWRGVIYPVFLQRMDVPFFTIRAVPHPEQHPRAEYISTSKNCSSSTTPALYFQLRQHPTYKASRSPTFTRNFISKCHTTATTREAMVRHYRILRKIHMPLDSERLLLGVQEVDSILRQSLSPLTEDNLPTALHRHRQILMEPHHLSVVLQHRSTLTEVSTVLHLQPHITHMANHLTVLGPHHQIHIEDNHHTLLHSKIHTEAHRTMVLQHPLPTNTPLVSPLAVAPAVQLQASSAPVSTTPQMNAISTPSTLTQKM